MNVFALSGLINFIVSIVFGFFVYFKDRKKEVNKSYLLYSLSIALWSFGYWQWLIASDKESAMLWSRLLTASAILIPGLYFRFVLVFINLYTNKKKKKILHISYIISFLFFLLSFTPLIIVDMVPKLSFDFWPEPGPLYSLYLLTFMGIVFYSIYMMFIAFRTSVGYKRNQIKYVLLGSILGFSGGATNFPLWYDIQLYPIGNFAVLAFFVTFTYAIIRYRLIDINIVFKRTAVYSLSVGLLTALFIVLVLMITDLFSTFSNVSSFKVSIFAAPFIALLFNPLRSKVQLFIDKLFYKKTYDYYSAVKKVSSRLTSMFDLRNIFRFIGDTISDALGLRSMYILSEVPGGGFVAGYHSPKNNKFMNLHGNDEVDKKVGNRSGIVKYFKNSGDIIIKDELPAVEAELGTELVENIVSDLKPFEGEAAVPVFEDGKLALIMILGEKLSGDMFTREDIQLLGTIAGQTAIALKNAKLYKDKINSERLASIGMMSATFAHEIRNPLTSLKTFAQLMPEKYNDEEFRGTFSKLVVREIDRINSLIGDLLDFSTEKNVGRVNEFELNTLIDEIIEYMKGRLEVDRQNILIEKVYNNHRVELYGNVEKLKQAFINIINNGCEAMNGSGILQVEIFPNSRSVDISISDTGEGIHPNEIPRIFDPFMTTKEMGVGLGLAISKRVIEDQHGKIEVKSKLSKGTTFTVSLPMKQV